MSVPLMRSYTTPGLALNVFGPSTDDITGLTIQQLNRSNIDCWLLRGPFGNFSRQPHMFDILPPTRR